MINTKSQTSYKISDGHNPEAVNILKQLMILLYRHVISWVFWWTYP